MNLQDRPIQAQGFTRSRSHYFKIRIFYLLAAAGAADDEGDPVSAPSCCDSNSTSCCSRSISMIKGTISTRKAVPAIQAALPENFAQ